MLLGLLIMLAPVPFLGFMPETLHYRAQTVSQPSQAPRAQTGPREPFWKSSFTAVRRAIQHSVGFLANDTRVGFLVLIFMLHLLLIVGVRDIVLQYTSISYHLSLSKSTLILSIRAGLNLFMMLLILPALSNWLNRRPAFQAHPSFADLQLARGSAIVMALGFLIMAAAGNLPLYIVGLIINTSGWGLMTYVRSLALSFVDEHVVARLFATLGLMDTVGIMVGVPTLAELFEFGVNKGGGWMGLPFLVCATFTAVASIGLATMRPGALDNGPEENEDEALLVAPSDS